MFESTLAFVKKVTGNIKHLVDNTGKLESRTIIWSVTTPQLHFTSLSIVWYMSMGHKGRRNWLTLLAKHHCFHSNSNVS